jgi:hypothetical protein
MSQAGIINTSSGPVPPTVATTYVTDVNSPAVPAANVLNVLGNDTTVNNNNGIRTDGSSGSNTLTLQLTNRLQGTGTTVGATTADLVTFSLGATPGAYNFELKVIGFDAVSPSATGFTILGTMRTSGAAAALVGTPDETVVEDIAMLTSDVDMVASGNNLIIRSTGVLGLSINWNVVATYVFIS